MSAVAERQFFSGVLKGYNYADYCLLGIVNTRYVWRSSWLGSFMLSSLQGCEQLSCLVDKKFQIYDSNAAMRTEATNCPL
jgi:hypothetical protein